VLFFFLALVFFLMESLLHRIEVKQVAVSELVLEQLEVLFQVGNWQKLDLVVLHYLEPLTVFEFLHWYLSLLFKSQVLRNFKSLAIRKNFDRGNLLHYLIICL